MSAELVAILSVGVAGLVGLSGLMLTLFTRLEQRMDRLEDRLDTRMDSGFGRLDTRIDSIEARLRTLEEGLAELRGEVTVIQEALFARAQTTG